MEASWDREGIATGGGSSSWDVILPDVNAGPFSSSPKTEGCSTEMKDMKDFKMLINWNSYMHYHYFTLFF